MLKPHAAAPSPLQVKLAKFQEDRHLRARRNVIPAPRRSEREIALARESREYWEQVRPQAGPWLGENICWKFHALGLPCQKPARHPEPCGLS